MLITDILDFARIEAAKLELSPTQLRLPEFLQVVTDIIRIKAEQKNLEFVYQPTPDLPMVIRADEKRLRQIPLDAAGHFHHAGLSRHRCPRRSGAVAQAERVQPDLILMYVMMPVMDGLEATRRMRRIPRLAQVPIIAVSASAFPVLSRKMQPDAARRGLPSSSPSPSSRRRC
jgi:CheY-like chemotaxis protein